MPSGADEGLLVVLVFLLVEFLGLEEVPDTHVAGLGHGADQLALRHMVVAGEGYRLDLDLGLAVHLESHPHGVLDHCVVDLYDVHVGVDEALLLVIVLDDADR